MCWGEFSSGRAERRKGRAQGHVQLGQRLVRRRGGGLLSGASAADLLSPGDEPGAPADRGPSIPAKEWGFGQKAISGLCNFVSLDV